MLKISWALLIISLVYINLANAQPSLQDPLGQLNIDATQGAAAGFVEDKACGTCHSKIYKTYQDVGMARSFSSPDNFESIERFGEEFYHAPSQRYYRIDKTAAQLTFYRYQKDGSGNAINQFSTPIAWVLGSGYRARSYLYKNDSGELFMLPIGWYQQSQEWAMSPGFEGATHFGVQRQIKRECMFCHNAFPDVATGSDQHLAGHFFPESLPQGTGCQRCHGPGADHIRAALSAKPKAEIHANIVNPSKLPVEQRDSVCFQCHMLPAVSMVGIRHFNQPTYSFKAGQKLTDYLAHVEVTQEGVNSDEQFEINHHGYRFWQSKCYQESQGELACITCHNPHEKPNTEVFRADVSKKCLNCHAQIATKHPELDKPIALESTQPITANSDCVACHMPTRRTRDVVKVSMTDHRIARGPFDLNAIQKPKEKTDPIIIDVNLLPWGDLPSQLDARLYRAVTVLRTKTNEGATNALKNMLISQEVTSPIPYIDLLKAEIKLGRYSDATSTAKYLLHQPNAPIFETLSLLGIAQLGSGSTAAAIASLNRAISLGNNPTNNYNLGLALLSEQLFKLALAQFDLAIELRPNMHSAWLYKGRTLAKMQQLAAATKAIKQSLAIAPNVEKTYVDLINLLNQQQQLDEAKRYLAVGLRVAESTEKLQQLQ